MNVKQILAKEGVRRVDGRWTNGFIDQSNLERLIKSGEAEVYNNQGIEFVRLAIPKTVTLPLDLVESIHDMLLTCGYGGRNRRAENQHEKALAKAIAATRKG